MHIAYVGRHGIPANATGRMRWRTAIDAVLHDGSCGVDQRSRELIEASDARPHGLRVRSLSFVDAASVACCGGSLIRSYGGDSIESFSSESIILPDAMGSTYRASLCFYYSRSAVRYVASSREFGGHLTPVHFSCVLFRLTLPLGWCHAWCSFCSSIYKSSKYVRCHMYILIS